MNELHLKEEQKEEIEALAGLRFPPEIIAVIMEIDIATFLKNYGYKDYDINKILDKYNAQSELFKTVERGRLRAEAEVRKSIFDMAKAGSSPAQSMVREMIKESQIRDLCFQ
jgi:hypothetical protein